MWPILVCSILAVAIIIERTWSLREKVVVPKNVLADIERMIATKHMTVNAIANLQKSSVLGRMLGASLTNNIQSPSELKEIVEDAGRREVHELERYLNTLGTIAATTPLLGLLGTVIGMIKVFSAITVVGVGDPQVLAGGISEALITTAAGLLVGIPCLMFHRYFRGRVNELTITMEQHSLHFLGMMRAKSER